jgi:hypothetical protein
MKYALKFLLLLLHYAIVAIVCYYIGDLMSKDTSGIGIVPNAIFLLCLIISIITHTKNFILSFKNQKTQL